jgi:solute carrier family 35 (GDP-fucose transporter), member C1
MHMVTGLKWVEVSFYNVARSLTIVFNVILSKIMLNSNSSNPTLACLGVVIVGFFMGSGGEINFSMKGTVAGILSSLFVSLNSIYTKKVLPVVDNDHWKLTFYNNINACIMFIPLMLTFENQAILSAFSMQFLSPTFWGAMWVAGFMGFAIGIVTVLQIKATSPLTHNISGTAKAAVQSILAFYIWGNEATFLGCLGIAVVLGGSLLYTYVKMEEGRQAPSSPPPSEKDVEMNRPLKGGPN